VIGALHLGLVAGFIKRALVPNDVLEGMSGPKSWLASIALGLVGAVVGWLIFTAGLGIGDTDVFDLGGILRSIIGVVIVLLVASVLDSIDGLIVLVGHSYGGAVITNAAVGRSQVEALVYIAGFAPDGESLVQLVTMNPGSEIGAGTLITRKYSLPAGGEGLTST
jgi:uncharacterized membrane protein YeaQ/YmgE (transglycosylase-associated protein family)